MRRLILMLLTPALLFGAPADVRAACGVPQARADFFTPEVQVYDRDKRLFACLRATGRERPLGVHRKGAVQLTSVDAVVGRRWVLTSTQTFSDDELEDIYDDVLTDLRTGRSVRVRTYDPDTLVETQALPGVLVEFGERGVLARYLDGRVQRLSSAPATSAAAFGSRVYWREEGVPRTAVVAVADADPARRAPLARTVGRCKPRPGARLLERSYGLIVTRAGGATWACFGTKARRVSAAATFSTFGLEVAYPGGVMNAKSGRRRELASPQLVNDGDALVGAGADGLRLWPAVTLSAEPASEPAIAHDMDGTVAYWLDASGVPRVTVIPQAAAAAAARATCGVPSARAEYETPEVQAYVRGSKLLACHRATGRERQVGIRVNDGMGTDESSYVNGVLGGRWVWTTMSATFAESPDVREDTLTDLRTGETVTTLVEEEAVALPGKLVVTDAAGVVAHSPDGGPERLSAVSATDPAAVGGRVYWSEGTVARTAVLAVPAGDPPRARPLARTVGKCKPRPGARLLLRAGKLVVSRAGGATWACRGTKARQVTTSAAVALLGDRELVYPGGVFNVANGVRRALDGTEAATDGRVRYWLDAAATPQRADF